MKEAIVLLGFGGPQSLSEVPSFLKQLFSDPCVLTYPALIRKPLAALIAKKSTKRATENYRRLGGKSPFLENTQKQAACLENLLNKKVFLAMRYGRPSFEEAIENVKAYNPEKVVLLPLYPQFSMTTTLSCFKEWDKHAHKLKADVQRICCYPQQPGFLEAYAGLLHQSLQDFQSVKNVRILFSAHGIPMKFVKKGDPYTEHILQTTKGILSRLKPKYKGVESVVCYQSRVGPLPWTQPYLEDEIKRAALDKKAVVVLPVAFTSEHSETLGELDIDYKEMADELDVPYKRVPTVSCHPSYIKGLKQLVEEKDRPKVCPDSKTQCWMCHREKACA